MTWSRSLNCTVPVGIPEPDAGLTLAARVAFEMPSGVTASVVVEPVSPTTCMTETGTAAAKVESPLYVTLMA